MLHKKKEREEKNWKGEYTSDTTVSNNVTLMRKPRGSNIICFVRKVCNKYSVVMFLLLQYDPTDYLGREEETSLRPKKEDTFERGFD